MPFFRHSAHGLRRIHMIVQNDTNDPELPYFVNQRPSHLIATGSCVTLSVSRMGISGIEARIGSIDVVHRGYVIFCLRDCDPAYRFLAIPFVWAHVTWVQFLLHRQQIRASLAETAPPLVRAYPEPVESIADSESGTRTTISDIDLSATQRFVRHATSMGTLFVMGRSVVDMHY